jgi:regulatory protein
MKQKNNPDMLRIYIDNAYAFSMPEEEYYRMNLYERAELTQEDIDTIREEINIKLAKQRGLRLLAVKDRSEHEIRERLKRLGFDMDVIEDAILQLKSMGYINDSLYAHKYVSERLKLKPKSKKALAYELQKKGIGSELIDEVISEFELDEHSIAFRIAKKKFGKYDVSDPKVQQKIISFLAFRGFSYEIIRTVLDQM